MNDQSYIGGTRPYAPPRPESTRDKMLKYHRANPHVLNIIAEQCRERIRRCVREGIRPIRAHATSICDEARDAGASGLVRDYMPLYSRLVMWKNEDLWGVFKVNPMTGESEARLRFYRQPTYPGEVRPPR